MEQLEQNRLETESVRARPVGLLVLDSGGVVRWVNPALEQLLGLPADRLLDRDRDSLPQPARQALSDKAEVRIQGTDGEQRWLRRESMCLPSFAGRDAATLYVYQDISDQIRLRSECDALRQQVRELTVTDDLTGLANRPALINALTAQVTRSRRYHNPLAVVMVEVELGDAKTQAIRELPERAVLAVSHYLRDRLRWADIIGRHDQSRFMLILPETDRQAATSLVRKIRAESAEIDLPRDLARLPFSLGFGIAEWEQGDDPRLLTERAIRAMQTENQIPAASSTAG